MRRDPRQENTQVPTGTWVQDKGNNGGVNDAKHNIIHSMRSGAQSERRRLTGGGCAGRSGGQRSVQGKGVGVRFK